MVGIGTDRWLLLILRTSRHSLPPTNQAALHSSICSPDMSAPSVSIFSPSLYHLYLPFYIPPALTVLGWGIIKKFTIPIPWLQYWSLNDNDNYLFKCGGCSRKRQLLENQFLRCTLNLDNWIKIKTLIEYLYSNGLYEKYKQQSKENINNKQYDSSMLKWHQFLSIQRRKTRNDCVGEDCDTGK